MKVEWIYVAYAMIWIASALVIGFTVYLTKNGNYLWFLLVPTLVSLKSHN
jgi:hypothetical protein